jgi:hypothetical protein
VILRESNNPDDAIPVNTARDMFAACSDTGKFQTDNYSALNILLMVILLQQQSRLLA